MKLIAKLTAMTMVAFLATASFAAGADSNSTKISLSLDSAKTIAGTKLEPGNYNVYVQRTGDDAKVRITQGKHEIVSTTGKYRAMARLNDSTALSVNKDSEVLELQSPKIKGAVVFDAEKAQTSEGSSK